MDFSFQGQNNDFAIRLAGLKYRWPDANEDLLDIPAWQVTRGQRVFLHGDSGSGKSTLLSIVGGIVTPQSGDCYVLGKNLATASAAKRDAWRADRIGFIFQQFNLIPYLSAVANITLPCRISKRRKIACGKDIVGSAEQLLSRVELPVALWHKPAMLLSIGQQQRVAAARALIGFPELVIADEPTSALDAGRQQEFLKLLGEVCLEARATLIYVSHDHRLADSFDSIVPLNAINAVQI